MFLALLEKRFSEIIHETWVNNMSLHFCETFLRSWSLNAWSTTLEYKAREKNADTSQEESIILYYAIAIDLNEKLFLNAF